ncbi:hypothetical protein [uncultured Endozoicomonas sp.]|uniref:hypothetical protein n=1 Tax=uncultured Endozoicomonas sp. TaxID=432652 RepID=UPI00262B465F|nr:hypothetical protein [uncultured Endozoicomonas sp.]
MRFSFQTSSLLISGLLLSSIVAADVAQPSGYWLLENSDDEKPFGSLKLDKPNQFALLVSDSNCELYQVTGSVREKQNNWELKSQNDHSNVFILTREADRIKLMDTEGQLMMFVPSSKKDLDQSINRISRQNCQLSAL